MNRRELNRLEASDFIYRFVDTALGWSVVLQVQWVFRSPPQRAALEDMATSLAESSLNRRLVASSVPFARPHWVGSTCPGTIDIDAAGVAPHAIVEWMDNELYSAPLDSEVGRSWRLRGARVDGGGFLLSLTALHLVADGKAMMSAALAAVAGSVIEHRGGPESSTSVVTESIDAARQLVGAVAGIGKAFATAALSVGTKRALELAPAAKSPMHERAPRARYAWATISVDRADWLAAAERHAGTANSLFIAVISGVLRGSGYAPLGTTIKVGVPVSQRSEGDERGNATAGVSVILVDEPVTGGDLSGIRAKCKHAFTQLAAGRRPAMVHLQPLIRLLPDSLIVKAATAGSGIPDVVASNLGRYPAALATVGDERASTVAFRGIAQGVNPALPYRFGEGLQSWLIEVGETVTFTVAAFDELHFDSGEKLRQLCSDELLGWGVPHEIY